MSIIILWTWSSWREIKIDKKQKSSKRLRLPVTWKLKCQYPVKQWNVDLIVK